MSQETVAGPAPVVTRQHWEGEPGAQPTSYPQPYDTYDATLFAISAHLGAEIYEKLPKSITSGANLSCGVTILSGLGVPPQDVVRKILKERAFTDRKRIREAFVMFSDVASSTGTEGRGEKLCQYIKDNNLGEILVLGPRMNPNSGNMIKLWMWAPPHKSLSPDHKQMPVFGKKCIRGPYGDPIYIDQSDHRFKDPRFPAIAVVEV